jgi:carbon-monoxide dehydrogenase small subunit
MTVKAFLDKNPKPTEDEIKQVLSGNFCRCISHYEVLKAVTAVTKGGEYGK